MSTVVSKPSVVIKRFSIKKNPRRLDSQNPQKNENGDFEYAWQNIRTSLPLAFADSLSVFTGMLPVIFVGRMWGTHPELGIGFVVANALALVAAFAMSGLYPACGISAAAEFRKVISTGAIVQAVFAISMLQSLGGIPFARLCLSMALSVGLLPIYRGIARQLCSHFNWWSQPVLIVGDGIQDHDLFETLRRDPASGLRPAGIVYGSDSPGYRASSNERYVGALKELPTLIHGQHCHRVIVAEGAAGEVGELLGPGAGAAHVHVLSGSRGIPTLWCESGERMGHAEVHFTDWLLLPTSRIIKRVMDIGLILLAAPFLLPVTILLATIVKLTSPGPVFYCQRRLAIGGQHFFAWKFRSMVANADEALRQYLDENPRLRAEWERDHKLKDDPRITKIGQILRKTSLDELPQLWNVLIGEMSLVGPRPIVDDEIPKYGDVYDLYKRVRPGITGLWQISGRNNTTYAERLSYDRYYVRNWSPWLDLFILLRTVKTVLLREGAY